MERKLIIDVACKVVKEYWSEMFMHINIWHLKMVAEFYAAYLFDCTKGMHTLANQHSFFYNSPVLNPPYCQKYFILIGSKVDS